MSHSAVLTQIHSVGRAMTSAPCSSAAVCASLSACPSRFTSALHDGLCTVVTQTRHTGFSSPPLSLFRSHQSLTRSLPLSLSSLCYCCLLPLFLISQGSIPDTTVQCVTSQIAQQRVHTHAGELSNSTCCKNFMAQGRGDKVQVMVLNGEAYTICSFK